MSTSFSSLISQGDIHNFLKVGFTIIDNAFGEKFCSSVRQEIINLYKSGLLYENKTYFEGKQEDAKFTYSQALAKPNIYELDLISLEKNMPNSQGSGENTEEKAFSMQSCCAIPNLRALYKDRTLLETINEYLPTIDLDWMDLKVQYNKGEGACFPMHFDTTPSVSRRQITCILYLNPDWEPGVGGELRIFPFPYKHIDIAPKMGRLVIFSSHQLLHRVLPSHLPRYCVTLWLDGSNFGKIYPGTFPWIKEIPFVMHLENRKTISKLIYSTEWEQSILLSFSKGNTSDIVKSHREHVERIEKKLGVEMVQFLRQSLPLSHSEEFLECCPPFLRKEIETDQ